MPKQSGYHWLFLMCFSKADLYFVDPEGRLYFHHNITNTTANVALKIDTIQKNLSNTTANKDKQKWSHIRGSQNNALVSRDEYKHYKSII